MGGIMKVKVGLNTNTESNQFLSCLWGILEDNEHIAWQTFGHLDRQKKKLIIGNLSCKLLSKCYIVSIYYKRKGVIDIIEFEDSSEHDLDKDDVKIINEAIKKSVKYKELTKKKYYKMFVKSVGNVTSSYIGEYHSILPIKKKKCMQITLAIDCFGSNDAKSLVKKKTTQIMSVLSTYLMLPLYLNDPYEKTDRNISENFFSNMKWIEIPPMDKEYQLLPKVTVDFIDKVISDNLSENEKKIIDASRMYHTGLKYLSFEFFWDRYPKLDFVNYDASAQEIANTLFMSTLEVLASIYKKDVSKCTECSQKIYSIRKGVLDLCDRFSDEYVFKSYISDYYNERSMYLHTGFHYDDNSYNSSSNPQIDSNSSLVNQLPSAEVINIRDAVGYIFRNVLEDVILPQDIVNE